ncbi:hypothetical protein M0811_10634 [Anaeramoeba ignava]|uniref:Uncharacterized protein n=1 Tax=Anaeramoeba ignava TaxID=1746090 RepID=A0A9Q0LH75_ANAIG|nr:hypothetical protein M0811_10634 [Anaeramoeba ignava]
MKIILFFCFSFTILISFIQNQPILNNSFDFPIGMRNPVFSLIDETNGFVYFLDCDLDDYSLNSSFYKSDLNTLDFIDSIYFENIDISIGVIDTINQMIYFGAVTLDDFDEEFSQIIQFDLSSFSISNLLNFSSLDSNFLYSEIDLINSKAYFIDSSDDTSIFKIDLSTFSFESNSSITGDYSIISTLIDIENENLYLFTEYDDDSNIEIHKFDLQNFSEIDILTLDQIPNNPESISGIIDNSTNLMYFGAFYYSSQSLFIVKINLTDFKYVDHITTILEEDTQVMKGGIDELNHLAYFLTSPNCMIFKINLTSFGFIDLYEFSNLECVLSFDSSTTNTFIGFNDSTIINFDLISFNPIKSGFILDFQNASVILIDELNQIGYVGFDYVFGLVSQINLTSFEIIDNLINDNFSDKIKCGEIDLSNGFAYFFINCEISNSEIIPKIMKIDLANSTNSEMKIIDSNGEIQTSCFDKENQIIYIGYSNFTEGNGKILEINSPNLEIINSFTISDF